MAGYNKEDFDSVPAKEFTTCVALQGIINQIKLNKPKAKLWRKLTPSNPECAMTLQQMFRMPNTIAIMAICRHFR
jgi:hypothetical protein